MLLGHAKLDTTARYTRVATQPPKGSTLTRGEALLGISGEGQAYTNPKGVAKAQALHDANVRQEYAARELKAEMKKDNPDTDTLTQLLAEVEDAKQEIAALKEGASSGGGGSSAGIDQGEASTKEDDQGERPARSEAPADERVAGGGFSGGGYVQGTAPAREYVQGGGAGTGAGRAEYVQAPAQQVAQRAPSAGPPSRGPGARIPRAPTARGITNRGSRRVRV